MKRVSTYTHAITDYIGAVVLFFAPEIFMFSEIGGAAVAVPRILAIVILIQALITDYEVSLAKIISVKAHLGLDYVAGIFLAISPFLFGFIGAPPNAWLPHIIVGLGVFLFALITEHAPRTYRSGHSGRDHQHSHRQGRGMESRL